MKVNGTGPTRLRDYRERRRLWGLSTFQHFNVVNDLVITIEIPTRSLSNCDLSKQADGEVAMPLGISSDPPHSRPCLDMHSVERCRKSWGADTADYYCSAFW